jgi:hypothetical protein
MDAPFSLEDVADYPPESFFFHPKSRRPSRCATPSRDDGKLEKFAANLEGPWRQPYGSAKVFTVCRSIGSTTILF